MTAEDIKQTNEAQRSVSGWLREIAYQLALLNAMTALNVVEVKPELKLKRK